MSLEISDGRVYDVTLTLTGDLNDVQPERRGQPDVKRVQAYVHESSATWLDYQTEVRSDNPLR